MASITVKSTEDVETKVELTPDYCFEKAAELLQYFRSLREQLDFAAEWRQLGLAMLQSPLHANG